MNQKQAKKTPQAFADLRQAARYLTIQQSERLAMRFVALAEQTFLKLAAMPTLGALYEEHQGEHEVRIWLVKGFEQYVIAYRIIPEGIEVLRVLHGARNWQDLLEQDE